MKKLSECRATVLQLDSCNLGEQARLGAAVPAAQRQLGAHCRSRCSTETRHCDRFSLGTHVRAHVKGALKQLACNGCVHMCWSTIMRSVHDTRCQQQAIVAQCMCCRRADVQDSQATDALVQGLTSSGRQLTSLRISNNSLTDVGAQLIASSCLPQRRLQHVARLELSYNCITVTGAVDLAHALQSGAQITELNLEGNLIGNDGARAIAQAMLCCRVSRLNVAYNITDSADLSCWLPVLQRASLSALEVAQLSPCSEPVCPTAHCANMHFSWPAFGAVQRLQQEAMWVVDTATDRLGAMQEDVTRLLDAACHCSIQTLDLRGTPLPASAHDAAARLLQTSTSVEVLRVTAAAPTDRAALTAAADMAWRSVSVQVAAPPRPSSVPPAAQRARDQQRPRSALQPFAPAQTLRMGGAAHDRSSRAQSADCGHARGSRRVSAAGSLSSTVRSASRKQPYPSAISITPSLKPRVSTLPAHLPDRAHAAGISAGGASDRAAAVFLKADTEGQGVISSARVAEALNELGLLRDLPPGQVCLLQLLCLHALRQANPAHPCGLSWPCSLLLQCPPSQLLQTVATH